MIETTMLIIVLGLEPNELSLLEEQCKNNYEIIYSEKIESKLYPNSMQSNNDRDNKK